MENELTNDRNKQSTEHTDQLDVAEKEKKLELEKEEVLRCVADAKTDTMLNRIAWILNHYPETRDSDITCQIKYWSIFQSDLYGSGFISCDDLYKMTRLTSIARARARIQNTHRLFIASPEVRKMRGVLTEEEKEKAIQQKPNYPAYIIYADESGKTSDYLIVGSMWILNGIETFNLYNAIAEWRVNTGFKSELHFKDINSGNIRYYREVLAILKEKASAISFKALSVERRGVRDINNTYTHLYFYLIVRGIEHENATGRAPLPRSIQLWKDADNPGSDKLMLEQIRERLEHVTISKFDNKLQIDEMRVVDSKKLVLIQFADLFTSSINRVLNTSNDQVLPKDQFAEEFLREFGLDKELKSYDGIGDCAFHASL